VDVEIYLVMPDLSRAKVEALKKLSRERAVSILVSYTTFKFKPSTLERLEELRKHANVKVMLDSGAYHMAKLKLNIDIRDYAHFASRHVKLFDIIVAPDRPGDARATISRTREFYKAYGNPILAVIQGSEVSEYIWCYRELINLGFIDGYLGIGGLDGPKRSKKWLSKLLSKLCVDNVKLHLFGAGARLAKTLTASYSWCIGSLDSGAWQAEIRYRRRQLGIDGDVVEANYKAMKRYLLRFTTPDPRRTREALKPHINQSLNTYPGHPIHEMVG
jgi:hypothetical protein